jgi:hypothetical protein
MAIADESDPREPPDQVMEEGGMEGASEEWHALGTRLQMLAVFLASAAIDLLFLALWVVVHRVVDLGIDRLGELEALDAFTLNVIRVFFTVSTLTVIGSYTVWDLLNTIRRIWSMT